MITTTARFDVDLWAAIGLHARRLGVGRSVFIRDAVRAHVARIEEQERISRDFVAADLDRLAARIDRIELFIRRVTGKRA